MSSFDLVSVAAVTVFVGGLAAVLWEILLKDPRSLLEMMTDSRRFAETPLPGHAIPAARLSAEGAKPAANLNHPRLAA